MAYSKGVIWRDIDSPTSGMTVNVPVTAADAGTPVNVCINNSTLLLAITLVFPITGVQDGQSARILPQNAITTVTTNVETGGLIQGLLTTLLGGGSGIYQFRADKKLWYKLAS